MSKTRSLVSLCTVLLATLPLISSAPRIADPAPEENPFAWLAGHWVGEGLGGVAEEIWAPSRGGAMMGMFRSVTGEKTGFYELMTIQQGKSGWEMRLRHFHADLRAWEEKDEPLVWPVSDMDGSSAAFGPVTYERDGADGLRVFVELEEGKEPVELRFERSKSEAIAAAK